MNQPIEFKTTIPSIAKSRDHSGVVPRCGIIALLLACFVPLPKMLPGARMIPKGRSPYSTLPRARSQS
jgi:hypothetical protein